MPPESSALKDTLFTPELVEALGAAVRETWPSFDTVAFLGLVFGEGWEGLELLQRMRRVTCALHCHLPENYREALSILLASRDRLPTGGFVSLVPSDFVTVFGLDDPDVSIPALETFTRLGSAEFAVRPFIDRYPGRMAAQLLAWAANADEAVRRLASEGCRPRLPWGMRLDALVADPRPIIPILDALRNDVSETVRRSVANNLNDISKDHPDLVVDVLRRWRGEPGGDTDELRALTRHALRTLVKRGDVDALSLLGFSAEPEILLLNLKVDPATVSLGEATYLEFELESTSDEAQDIIVDYILHLVRANGELTPKVFKYRQLTIGPGERVSFRKKVSFAPVTTRKYYPGTHLLQPQVNGVPMESVELQVLAAPNADGTGGP